MMKSIRELTIKDVIHLVFSIRTLCLLAANISALSLGYYLLWSSNIADHTILVSGLPKQGIALTVAAITGISITFAVSIFNPAKRMFEKIKQWIFYFMLSAAFGYASAINVFEVHVYLYPEKVIDYITDYKVSFPGPTNGKHRCEAGIWIKEQHTGRWLELCSSKEQLKLGEKRRQGMNGMYVVAQVNRYGSYIQHYEFAFK
ncbi:hypothetical protein [Dickeya fangzhongdai]|nr:hypothetical protein [Dickeya fangzhongdai]WES90669.1 hypothetical protein PQ617_09285 [Dickeya fangzhongdai]WOY02178.1 hypothetical protein OGM22_10465 [Dickeya fangzhongdai]WOY02626.1 hypothetical protein OGM21_11935 [Dickeya fangzhongdai]